MTCKIDGFIFSTVICTPVGRELLISDIFDSIRCFARSISVFQSIKADISQVPLLVVLRIFNRSGTCLITFSSGFVTVTIILSTGWRPASAMILIFGKVISGNKEVLNWLYTKTPPSRMINKQAVIGFLYETK